MVLPIRTATQQHLCVADESLKPSSANGLCELFIDIDLNDYISKNPNLAGENLGKPITFVYIDDKAVRYSGQSADELVSELENFKAYWEK